MKVPGRWRRRDRSRLCGSSTAARDRRAAPTRDRQPERDRPAHRALAHDRHDARQRPSGKGARRRAAARSRSQGRGRPPTLLRLDPVRRGRASGSTSTTVTSASRSPTCRRPSSPSARRISTSTTQRRPRSTPPTELVDVVLDEAGIERARVVGVGVALSGPVDARRHRRLDGDPARLGRAERCRRADANGSTFRWPSTTTPTSARSPRSRSAPEEASPTSST